MIFGLTLTFPVEFSFFFFLPFALISSCTAPGAVTIFVTAPTFEEPHDVPLASPGLGRELTTEEHIALLKERNAKAREAMNGLVAENAQLRAELGR